MEKKEKEAKELQLKISREFGLLPISLSLCSNIKTKIVSVIWNNEEPLEEFSIAK